MKKLSTLLFLFLFLTPIAFAGVLTGSIQFEGAVPEMEKLSMSADPSCASSHTNPVFSEAVVVNDNATLRNVFVYIKEGVKGEYSPPDDKKSLDERPIIDQQGCRYIPHVLGVMTKQKFVIRNSDSTLHNVHSLAENSKQFNLGMPIQGMKLLKSFDASEVMVKVKCDVHPWMRAYIGVLDHPFFSVSDGQGNFTIKDLPDGDYVVEAWHETYAAQTQAVTLTDGEHKTISFTFGAA